MVTLSSKQLNTILFCHSTNDAAAALFIQVIREFHTQETKIFLNFNPVLKAASQLTDALQ